MVHHGIPWLYHGIPCLHYGIAEELIHLKYTITKISSYMTDETCSKARRSQRQLRTFDTLFALKVAMLVFELPGDCSKLTKGQNIHKSASTHKVAASALDCQHAMHKVNIYQTNTQTERIISYTK